MTKAFFFTFYVWASRNKMSRITRWSESHSVQCKMIKRAAGSRDEKGYTYAGFNGTVKENSKKESDGEREKKKERKRAS